MPRSPDDLSKGVAIGSGVYIDEHTHIEAVRYPDKSDTMGMLATILTGGRPGPGRVALWLKNLVVSLGAASLSHHTAVAAREVGARIGDPAVHAGAGGSYRHALGAACLLAVPEIPGQPRKYVCRRLFRRPTNLPRSSPSVAGGTAMSMLPEILFDVPGTAHCLGGCVIAGSPDEGVVDARHRVFGYRNMYVCDGSVVAANLGVNPSLTITALTERAMSFIPPASSRDVGRRRPN